MISNHRVIQGFTPYLYTDFKTAESAAARRALRMVGLRRLPFPEPLSATELRLSTTCIRSEDEDAAPTQVSPISSCKRAGSAMEARTTLSSKLVRETWPRIRCRSALDRPCGTPHRPRPRNLTRPFATYGVLRWWNALHDYDHVCHRGPSPRRHQHALSG